MAAVSKEDVSYSQGLRPLCFYSMDAYAVNGNARAITRAHAMKLPHHPCRLCTIPNALTLLRPVCTGPFVLLCVQAHTTPHPWAGLGALMLFLVIVASDFLDGWLARRRCQESILGRMLDHGCDVLFILTALGTFVGYGLVPWWLPSAIAWSFGLYVLDSWWRTAAEPQLLTSRLGHLGGVLYYLLVGTLTADIVAGHTWIPARVLSGCITVLTLLALLSGVERLAHLVRAWRRSFLASPAARTPDLASR